MAIERFLKNCELTFAMCLIIIFTLISYSTCMEISIDSTKINLSEILPNMLSAGYKYGIFHTLERLKEWAMKEEYIIKIATKRLELAEFETSLLKRYLEDYEESTGQAIKNAHADISTPEARGLILGKSVLLAHRMTHRYSSTLRYLRDFYVSSEYTENINSINKTLDLQKTEPWVNTKDMFFSMMGFLHLEEVYHTQPEKIMKGLEIDTKAGGHLNPVHCAEIGMLALRRHHYFASVEWIELTEKLIRESSLKDEGISSLPLDLSKSLTQVAIQEHNYVGSSQEADRYFDLYSYLYELPIYPPKYNIRRFTTRYAEFLRYRGFASENSFFTHDAQFSNLCMGNQFQPLEIAKSLRCYYENRKHPFLYISPVKTEVLSESPPIFQFYDILGDETNKLIQQRMEPQVAPSRIVGLEDEETIAVWRTSASIGMYESSMPKGVYSLGEMVSGLKIQNNSEHTQYAEYTYGRFYTQHTDTLGNSKHTLDVVEKTGDRMATLLYYLEIPDMGGKTPFCDPGVSAHPVRGSAILWYNLYRNGTARRDVQHGACPVIHGHKIVMNHWIYRVGNWDTYKCSLNQFE